VREALKILLGEKGAARIRMGLAKDGSGVGGKLAKP
jgi:hexokinase